MHAGAECISEHESLLKAVQLTRDLDVGDDLVGGVPVDGGHAGDLVQ